MSLRSPKLLILLVLILVLSGCAWYLKGRPASQLTGQEANTAKPASPIPAFTPEVAAQLAKSTGFSMLISYTDKGFEPAKATLKSGDTVRFTNNSSHELLIAEDGATDCASNCFNSGTTLKPGEFWEYTFNRKGLHTYHNDAKAGDGASVQVE